MRRLPLALSLQHAEDLVSTLSSEFAFTPRQVEKARILASAGLPPLVTTEVLPFMFGITNRLVNSMSRFPDRHYRTYRIKKKTGGWREIQAPRRFLKAIQLWIYTYVLRNYPMPSFVTGFAPGRSIFSNARQHASHRNLMVVDISQFFPSVTKSQVTQVYKSLGFPPKVAYVLAGICTLKGVLPQGAPTSPALSNIVFIPVDLRLCEKAKEWDCTYTRYADDIAFSGSFRFGPKDIDAVCHIVAESGFMVNKRKCRIIGSGGRQLLTGLVVNRKALPQRSKRMKWRATFHRANLHPESYLGQSRKLKGIAAYVNEYDPSLAKRYFSVAARVATLEGKSRR